MALAKAGGGGPGLAGVNRVTCPTIMRTTSVDHPVHVGWAIEEVARANNLSVVRELVGHGIGRAMHEPPEVRNYGMPGRGLRLRPGMVIAIEPMFNLGTAEVQTLDDGWTVATRDRNWSAHFEHTVAITEAGPQVLTAP